MYAYVDSDAIQLLSEEEDVLKQKANGKKLESTER
jgi:hypothetical protein